MNALISTLLPLAYLDPGTGSLVLQVVLAALASAAVMAKLFWHRLLVMLRLRPPAAPKTAHAPTEDEAQPREE